MPSAGIVIVPLAGLAVELAVANGVSPSIPVTEKTEIIFRTIEFEKFSTTLPVVPVGTAATKTDIRWKLAVEFSRVATSVANIPPIVAV